MFWMFEFWTPKGKNEAFLTHPLHLITVPLFGQLTVQLWMEKKGRGVDLVLWSNPFKEWLCRQVKEKIPVFKLLVIEQSNKMKYFHLCLTWVACFNFGEAKIGIVSIYNSSYFIQHFTWKIPTITWLTSCIGIAEWHLLISVGCKITGAHDCLQAHNSQRILTHVISFDSLSDVLAHCFHETKII